MSSQQILLGQGGRVGGQQEYTTANTYTWTCPDGVDSISVVTVGAGGACGNFFSNWPGGMNRFQGGGGGALAYKNNISVTPGNTYEVIVAAAGGTLGQTPGAYSHFKDGGTIHARAGSGGTNNSDGTGGAAGTRLYGTGYNGGAGAANGVDVNTGAGSGAGAGGYSGTGGQGVLGQSGPAAGGNGSGGGGGAGGCSQSPLSGGGGGGVGIQGEGPSGQGGAAGVNGGEGGSGGTDGSGNYPQNGGVHGGGGGYWAGGGVGAVRIIWPGTDRQFPSTETADW